MATGSGTGTPASTAIQATIALATFRTQMQSLVPDYDTELSDEQCNRAVRAAVEQYSKDFPHFEVDDVTGDGGRYYALASVLDSWSEGFSRVAQIEYPAPAVASDETPVYLDVEDWRDDYWTSDTRYLYLPHHAPAATETMRIRYTKPYGWAGGGSETAVADEGHGFSVGDLGYLDGSTFTTVSADDYKATHVVSTVVDADNFKYKALYCNIPPGHFFAVCFLAACMACRVIATSYAQIGDSTIAADSAAHQTKSDTYAARAEDYCGKYAEIVGLESAAEAAAVKPAGTFVDFDTAPEWPSGRRYIFRGNR